MPTKNGSLDRQLIAWIVTIILIFLAIMSLTMMDYHLHLSIVGMGVAALFTFCHAGSLTKEEWKDGSIARIPLFLVAPGVLAITTAFCATIIARTPMELITAGFICTALLGAISGGLGIGIRFFLMLASEYLVTFAKEKQS